MIKIIILLIAGLFFANDYTNNFNSNNISIPSSSPLPTITPTNKTIVTQTTIGWLVYPNAVIVSQNSDKVFSKSEDKIETITEYYEKVFDKNGSKNKSFIRTNTNENILNKLSGVIKGKTLTVEIKKDSGSSTVYINIIY